METRSTLRSGNGSFSASATSQADVAGKSLVQRAVAADRQHGVVDVGQQHRPAAALQPAETDVAGAAGQVQQGQLWARLQVIDENLFPDAMNA